MVSTNGKTIHGKNRGLGSISNHVGGYLNDASLQVIARSMANTTLQPPENGRLLRKDTRSPEGDAMETVGVSEFSDRWGRGHKLRSGSIPDLTGKSMGSMESISDGSPTC